ncbi:hypothetical protein OSB04_027567 [Centaurea solstitialis]|uniref:Uncharacterized protein n=1 Tax=Centaurea solstitialis TaxID=347529 RepID=A0AA38SR35_9ASTR|nr:hypothetical protein OSB04_027567 [Centaurea solstitialis]
MFPRLARLEDRVEASIAERGEWVENKWVWKWGWRINRRGREVGELEVLESSVVSQRIRISITWGWTLIPSFAQDAEKRSKMKITPLSGAERFGKEMVSSRDDVEGGKSSQRKEGQHSEHCTAAAYGCFRGCCCFLLSAAAARLQLLSVFGYHCFSSFYSSNNNLVHSVWPLA